MKTLTLVELEQQIRALSLGDQLLLIERIARSMRQESGRASFEASIAEMAADPDIQADMLRGNKIAPRGAMTNHNAEVGCQLVGEYVDEAELPTVVPLNRS